MTVCNGIEDNPYVRAAEYLEQHGWHQGEYFASTEGTIGVREHGMTPPACVIGSLIATEQPEEAQSADYTGLLLNVLLGQHQGNILNLALWNDEPGRSLEDVMLLLKQAAIDWDEGRRDLS
jgi:hypothetical protein